MGTGAGAEVGVASCVLAACGMSDCTARAAFSAARASARFFGIGTSIARATGLACATGLHMQRDSHVRHDLHEDSHVQKDSHVRQDLYVQQRTCTCDRTRMCNRTFTCNRTRMCEGCNAPHLSPCCIKTVFVVVVYIADCGQAQAHSVGIMLGLGCMIVAAEIVIVYPGLTLVSPKQG